MLAPIFPAPVKQRTDSVQMEIRVWNRAVGFCAVGCRARVRDVEGEVGHGAFVVGVCVEGAKVCYAEDGEGWGGRLGEGEGERDERKRDEGGEVHFGLFCLGEPEIELSLSPEKGLKAIQNWRRLMAKKRDK